MDKNFWMPRLRSVSIFFTSSRCCNEQLALCVILMWIPHSDTKKVILTKPLFMDAKWFAHWIHRFLVFQTENCFKRFWFRLIHSRLSLWAHSSKYGTEEPICYSYEVIDNLIVLSSNRTLSNNPNFTLFAQQQR